MSIKLNTTPITDPTNFPYLAEFKGSRKDVYWLTMLGCGIKISGGGNRPVGTYATSLSTNMDNWEILPKGTSFTFTQE